MALVLLQNLFNKHSTKTCKYLWSNCVAPSSSSSAAVSVKDSNGTFVSTLSMILYNVSTTLDRKLNIEIISYMDEVIFESDDVKKYLTIRLNHKSYYVYILH